MKRMTKKEAAEAKIQTAADLAKLCEGVQRVYVVTVHQSAKYEWCKLLALKDGSLLNITYQLQQYQDNPVNKHGGYRLKRGSGVCKTQQIWWVLRRMGAAPNAEIFRI